MKAKQALQYDPNGENSARINRAVLNLSIKMKITAQEAFQVLLNKLVSKKKGEGQ